MNFDSPFSMYWAIATDVVLISSGLVFVLRLYIVQLRVERGLPGHYRFGQAAGILDTRIAPEERWFLADDPEQPARMRPDFQRLQRLGKIVQWLSLLVLAVALILATGLVSAAASTGMLSGSAVVLPRCVIQYANTSRNASSTCSDNTMFSSVVLSATTSSSDTTVSRGSSF